MLNLLQILIKFPSADTFDATNTVALNGTGNSRYVGRHHSSEFGVTIAFAPVYLCFRPAGLAIESWNRAVPSNYYPASGLPSGVIGAVSSSSSNWTSIYSNLNTISTPVSITFRAGTVPKAADTIVDSGLNGLAHNNEAINTLSIGRLSGGLTYSGRAASFTMPADTSESGFMAVAEVDASGLYIDSNYNFNTGAIGTVTGCLSSSSDEAPAVPSSQITFEPLVATGPKGFTWL
jgi:hypothetical protein